MYLFPQSTAWCAGADVVVEPQSKDGFTDGVTRRVERDESWTGKGGWKVKKTKKNLKGNSITSASTVSTNPHLMSFPERAALWIFMKVTFDSNLS